MFRVKTTVDDEIPGSIPIAQVLHVALSAIVSFILWGGAPREKTFLTGGTYGGGGGGGGGPDDFDPPPPIVSI